MAAKKNKSTLDDTIMNETPEENRRRYVVLQDGTIIHGVDEEKSMFNTGDVVNLAPWHAEQLRFADVRLEDVPDEVV